MKKAMLIFFMFLIAVLMCFGVSATAISGSSVSSVTSDGKNVKICADITLSYIDTDTSVYVFAVRNPEDRLLIPLGRAQAVRDFEISVPYSVNDGYDLYTGFVLAVSSDDGYEAITGISYIENVTDFAENKSVRPDVYSLKGIETVFVTDAERLGAQNTTVNVYPELLLSDTGVPFVFGGETRYISADILARLDNRVKTLTAAGIRVFMNICLTAGSKNGVPFDADRFAAVLHFLAERYSDESELYGFCGDYIIGHRVNEEYDGSETPFDYAYDYMLWLRKCYVSVASAYSDGRVFASVSNRLKSDLNTDKMGGDELIDYLRIICGGFQFGISTEIIEMGEESADRGYLTLENIGAFAERYSDTAMVISEFGIDTGDENAADTLRNAYRQFAEFKNIEAVIWHRQTDSVGEKIHYGLYSSDGFGNPLKKKDLWDVFRNVDTTLIIPEITVEKKILKECPVFDFSVSDCGLFPCDNSKYLLCADGYTRIASDSAGTIGYFGAGTKFSKTLLSGCETISFSLRVIGNSTPRATILLSCGSTVLEAETKVESGEWITVSFRISDFEKQSDGDTVIMKIWAKNDFGSSEMFLDLAGISIDSSGKNIFPIVFLVIGSVFLLTVAAVVTVGLLKRKAD